MSGFTQVNYWLAETVSDTMLSGGCSWVDADKHSFSLLPASVLVGEQIISAYCWVLREHASVSF